VACFSAWAQVEVAAQQNTGSATCTGILGYIESMFEVLVFVYEHYWRGDACPELPQLERKLNAHGFEPDEIHDALVWLDGLNLAAQNIRSGAATPDAPQAAALQSASSLRIYSVAEQDHLGAQCLGFVSFLESSGVLPPAMREIVMDRAMAAPGGPVSLDDLKIIILMVYWSFGEEPDALVLDELCEPAEGRLPH
jgi:Smg protein